jgi:hypothetical protein
MHHWLVVEPYPSEKYHFVSWDDDIPNIWENKKCSKPPTRLIIEGGFHGDLSVMIDTTPSQKSTMEPKNSGTMTKKISFRS